MSEPSAPQSVPEAKPLRAAPIALWRMAEAFLTMLYTLFGAPEDVAERHTVTGKSHALMASWLRAGEAMMRRLLLIEAAALPRTNARPLLWPQRKRVRHARAFYPDKPEDWRVCFRCFSNMDRRRPRRPAPPHAGNTPAKRTRVSREDRWSYERFKPVRFRSAWPLAERYEALLRVFNDPALYARRLARRLYAVPHRAGELLRDNPVGKVGAESMARLERAARGALRRSFNSS